MTFGKKIECPQAGQQIFDQGQQSKKLYFLAQGVVRVSRLLMDGERHVLAFKWPCSFFGMKHDGVFANHAQTLTPCVIYEFESDAFAQALIAHPSVQMKVLQLALNQISTAHRQLIVVGRLGAQRALAAFLLECATHKDYFNHETMMLKLPMSRYDIADYLGAANESVTRALTRLEANGMIRRATPRDLTLNIEKLKKLANLD